MSPLTATEAVSAERTESAFWAAYARNIPTSDDTRDTGAVPVAGGFAVCLQGAYLQYGLGVGTSRPLRPDDLRIVAEFYAARGVPPRLELHPDVAARDAALLAAWGYHPELEMEVFGADLSSEPAPPRVELEVMTARRAEWIDLVVAGFADTVPREDHTRLRRSTLVNAAAASDLLAARIDGRLAGGGAIGVTGDVAFLYSASTLPAYRRHGVHAALIAGRLAAARRRGVTFAFLKAAPGGGSAASARAAGFVGRYVRRRMRAG